MTFIDGDKGELLYRGYPIEQLAELQLPRSDRLLKNGDLPNAKQKTDFESTIKAHDGPRAADRSIWFPPRCPSDGRGDRRRRCPVERSTTTRWTSDAEHRNISFNRLVDADDRRHGLKYNTGAPFMYPDNDLDYAANFMRMMFGNPCERHAEPVLVRALDIHFHAARRPRAERFDLDRASGRFVGSQPVRLYRCRYRLPLGPGARWCQRGPPVDAGGDRDVSRIGRSTSSVPRTRTTSS